VEKRKGKILSPHTFKEFYFSYQTSCEDVIESDFFETLNFFSPTAA
jgi:hypothetical protein